MGLKNVMIRYKLFFVSVMFTIPIVLLLYFFITEKNIAIRFGTKEYYGNEILCTVRVLMENTLRYHRDILDNNDASSSIAGINSSISDINKKNKSLLESDPYSDMIQSKQFSDMEESWQNISSNGYDSFHQRVRDYWSRIGDTSNLILDPDLDSYYLMDFTLLRVPESLTLLDSAYSLICGFSSDDLYVQRSKNSAIWTEYEDVQREYTLIKNSIEELNNAFESAVQSVNMLNDVLQRNAAKYEMLTGQAVLSSETAVSLAESVAFFKT